jgi:glycosyltransferase involved in cell wall biosynthesis
MDHSANSSPCGPNAAFDKPRVLILLGCFFPAYKAGGPIRSIRNLVDALGAEFHFRIVTSDRDIGDTQPFPGIAPNCWIRVGGVEVLYLPPGLNGLVCIARTLFAVDQHAVLYLNSFFDRRFSMFPALLCQLGFCRPRSVLLAPRGEFSPGALELKSSRKSLFIRIARRLGTYQNILWHASTPLEEQDIERQFGPLGSGRSRKAFSALDMVTAAHPTTERARRKDSGRLEIVFLGRCSPKKNLLVALGLLSGLAGDISFNIYGPVEDEGYWVKCQRLISTLPPNIRVTYKGQVEHERVAGIFAEHHLFLFPTLGENFGHVISEALIAGCPVLISDQTPWRNLEAEGVGWDIPLNQPESFRAALRQCVAGGDEWFASISQSATSYALRHATDPATLAANRKLFQEAASWPGSDPLSRQ